MTGPELAAVTDAVAMLRVGRTNDALETLVTVIREAGGDVPPAPVIPEKRGAEVRQ